ncbi:unnamed protein product [Thelazia callipaeda]|uniref:Serpentine receptor class gamma n=1 Tax=Thelazia callipaeda TaxID=103827 RepID=A0A0N5CRU7_THECL|nr:unnamed protein product [Thelazia callipaeda]
MPHNAKKLYIHRCIRLCTVVAYIFFVSAPAISLSIYYIWIWDPNYITKVSLHF